MIVDGIRAHSVHQLIEAFRRKLFEEGISLSAGADAVNNIGAVIVFFQHLLAGSDVILQIRIHGNRQIRGVLHCHQARQQRVLMSAVAGQIDAGIHRVLRVQLRDQFPGPVLRAVVDKDDPAVGMCKSFADKVSELLLQAL